MQQEALVLKIEPATKANTSLQSWARDNYKRNRDKYTMKYQKYSSLGDKTEFLHHN